MAYNKKSWAKAKEEEKKKWADDALEQISFHKMRTEDVKEYFEFMSNMYDYSPRNIGMMKNQYPGAEFVASKEKFKELGFDILENQKPIKILAPNKVTYLKLGNDNLKQLKYATKEEREKVKNKEIKTVQKTFYKLAPVYDLTQTNAKPEDYPKVYPNARIDLKLDNPKLALEIKKANIKYLEKLGIPVSVENFSVNGLGTAKGYYEPLNHKIALNSLNTESENVMTLVHETAHALMHNKESTYVKEYKGLNVKELEAELTSFVVNKHFGIDTSEQTIPYIASWTDNLKNIKDIESSLKDIQHTSSRIINGIEENISKEFLKEMKNELNTNNINEIRLSLSNYKYDDYKGLIELHESEIKDLFKSSDIKIRKGTDFEILEQKDTNFIDRSYLVINNPNNIKSSDLSDIKDALITKLENSEFNRTGIDFNTTAINLVEIQDDRLKVSNQIANISDIDINNQSKEASQFYKECIELFDKTNNVTVIDNISLDGNYPMDFEEFKELQLHLPIKSNTKTEVALETTEISKPSYLVKRLDELSKTKTVGLDIDGNFKQPIIHIKETNQVMPLKVLSKNIKNNDFDIEAFTYEVYTNPHQKLFDGDFNVFNNKTVMEQVKIDADLNGVPDIYQKSIDNMKESNISRESTHEKKMELN